MSTDVLIANPLPSNTTKPACGLVSDMAPELDAASGTSSALLIDEAAPKTLSAICSDYVQLTKPRIVVMILITTIMTAIIGAGAMVSLSQLAWLLAGTAMVAASAGAANQIWERVIDCNMARTASRPLPDGRLSVIPATLFTAVLGIVGTYLLYSCFGISPAVAGATTWLLYVLVYTPMKTRTSWNTTVGAIAGALPVLIGYTALGGTYYDATGWLMVGVLVAWQYPHFMSIAWMYRRQYDEAGFRMTTTVEPTGRSAGWQAIAGSIALIICGVVLCFIPGGITGGTIASVLVFLSGFPMLKASIRFASAPGDQLARKLLRSSLLVLPAVLAIVTVRVFL